MEGNGIVLVWGCTQNGRKWNCVGLGMYREWKEMELCWFVDVQRMEEHRIPKRVLYMNLETRRPRGRPRNRSQEEVREDGRIVGEEEWQERVYDREEQKKLLRTRNLCIQHMPME
jgi:hypothetical protein